MKNKNPIGIYAFKTLLNNNYNKMVSLADKSDFIIKHELKKQIKEMKSILLNITKTKQGSAFLKSVFADEEVSATRYVSNPIRKLDMTYTNFASLGLYLVALNDTRNHENATIVTKDMRDCEFLNLKDIYKNEHFYITAEMVLKREGVTIQNVLNSQDKQRLTDCMEFMEEENRANANDINTSFEKTDETNTNSNSDFDML